MRPGAYFNLQAGKEGEIYYLEAPSGNRSPFSRETKLKKFDLKKRQAEDILAGVNWFMISADKKKITIIYHNCYHLTVFERDPRFKTETVRVPEGAHRSAIISVS